MTRSTSSFPWRTTTRCLPLRFSGALSFISAWPERAGRFVHLSNANDLRSKLHPSPVDVPLIYGWQRMSTMDKPGAILMEDFSLRNCAIVNEAEGLELSQVSFASPSRWQDMSPKTSTVWPYR